MSVVFSFYRIDQAPPAGDKNAPVNLSTDGGFTNFKFSGGDPTAIQKLMGKMEKNFGPGCGCDAAIPGSPAAGAAAAGAGAKAAAVQNALEEQRRKQSEAGDKAKEDAKAAIEAEKERAKEDIKKKEEAAKKDADEKERQNKEKQKVAE